MNEQRIILGAPYVFSRQNLAKPAHTEVVTIPVRGVHCHNDCGLYWIAADDAAMLPGDVCPGCDAPPKPWCIGTEPEEIDVVVHMAFGNVVDVQYLQSRGKVTCRQLVGTITPSPSLAIVKPT